MSNFFKVLQDLWIGLLQDISGFNMELLRQPAAGNQGLEVADKLKKRQGI